ncbi:MAG: rod shape-determining protein MreC [Sulfurospirillaceae bacterium]|nr:rod shape-determining protein MreC [Sulfurospirillaceae bacterium]
MSNRLKIFALIAIFVIVSYKFGGNARGVITSVNTNVLTYFFNIKEAFSNKINEHFAQQEEILKLRAENQKIQKSALLSIAFAGKLNELLRENNVSKYAPDVELVRAISYANLDNYDRIWVDFKDFNASKIYGLLHQGNAAGIVVQSDGNPLALLLRDPKCIYSVYIGKDRIPGIAFGNKKEVLVKYIPIWTNPKEGDEVFTSGLDNIFFDGVRVGVIESIAEDGTAKTAVIKPHVKVSTPAYVHVITKN